MNELGITKNKNTEFNEWYGEIVRKCDLLDYSTISGCYTLKPLSYEVWEFIQEYINKDIKKMGVKNCYFPMFVKKEALEKEQEHLEGFSPEVAWVTKCGNSNLVEHIAIRPTSEAIIYPTIKNWIKSFRDLPLKINQWCNIVRWEFKDPTPFIRSREFLWQEGHTSFKTKKEAEEDVLNILDLYEKVYQDLLAVPVIKGYKTATEKFCGADYTTTVEIYIPASQKAVQAATSHHLGQHFSKIFDLSYDDENLKKQYVYQNSWGLTTRSIGIMLMTHSDNRGVIFPPKVAPIQVVFVMMLNKKVTPELKVKMIEKVNELKDKLTFRCHFDDREHLSTGFKYNYWEQRGVPIRIELGPRDFDNNQVVVCRRDKPIGQSKTTVTHDEFVSCVDQILIDIQNNLYHVAQTNMFDRLKDCDNFVMFFDIINDNIVQVPWCQSSQCEKEICDKTKNIANIKSLCVPFQQPDIIDKKCINCGGLAKQWVIFGKSY
jgi:prolyl-tRNA synthetase